MTLRIESREPTLTPMEFIAKWHDTRFGERQASQTFFNDICALVGHPAPADYQNPEAFTFDKWVPGGFADAYLEGRFGWEFKGSDAQLTGAFTQLLRYSVYLKTPPLLIVSSFRTILIRTSFPGTETVLYRIPVAELVLTEQLNRLRWAFFDPERLRSDRSVEEVTKETANLFRAIVEDMEQHCPDSEKLARYLNQLVFCLYAEDAGLLPNELFSDIVRNLYRDHARFNRAVTDLFSQMSAGGLFGYTSIAHFNGDLFSTADTVAISSVAMQYLLEATQKNWQNIEPSIFGTLFEQVLDAGKRSQLGAHYTGAEEIMLVVEPVVMAPLRREWEIARRETQNLLVEGDSDAAQARLEKFRQRLFEVTVLDPACGSGNFLYVALRSLLDLEKEVINFAAEQGWNDLTPRVRPDQMMGLEINPYAVELARTALWIGYIQWHENNGFPYTRQPILTPLNTIRQTDAILDLTDPDNPKEPEWPAAEFIIGNPPFLGQAWMRERLGDEYQDAVYTVYDDRLPRTSDLCCYWFERARGEIVAGKTQRVGLLATQGIRGGANRTALQRISEDGGIFMAYPDRDWVLDGATVHVSIIGFDGVFRFDGDGKERLFDGKKIAGHINPDLTVGVNVTQSLTLPENKGICFRRQGSVNPFDIAGETTKLMLSQPLNVNGRPNSDVIRPVFNGSDITGNPRGLHRIVFNLNSEAECAQYEMPFEHIKAISGSGTARPNWWKHERRSANIDRLEQLERYIVTPRVSKHRLFVWMDSTAITTDATVVFLREDDYFFGVLHSRFHELWARGKGSQLREAESGFRYTPTDCFLTFPFPEPTDEQRDTIAKAAVNLDSLRGKWLKPVDEEGKPGLSGDELKGRTLTNLYNRNFTWLVDAHKELDAAVAAAYGWPVDLDDQAVLGRLLALNLERAGGEAAYRKG